jgi:hypothetical protein
LLDVLAGDLVAAGYAVGVDGEQDTHAVPGAGRDLGGRGAGGQLQRQRGMAKVVGAACRTGACVARDGCGTGLVPDPAVLAFAERPAAGTPEQPVGAENTVTSCDLRILVDQATEPAASPDADLVVGRGGVSPAVRWFLAECPVRPVVL